MKKSVEIIAHIFFWISFTAFVIILSQIYLRPNRIQHYHNTLLPCFPGTDYVSYFILYNIPGYPSGPQE